RLRGGRRRASAHVVLDVDRRHRRGGGGAAQTMSDEQSVPQQPEVEESRLISVRRERRARIVELGYDAFPTKADVDTTIADVVAKYTPSSAQELEAAPVRVKIAGRIMAVREFGKTAFLVLSEK